MATTPHPPSEASAEVAIRVSGVHKHYGAVHAVQGVDLTVQRGELFGLIGHNGAGKSTLFKMMLGLIPVTRGDIAIDGIPVRGGQFREVRRHVGYLPENVVLYDNLSGLETLQFFARLKRVDVATCPALLDQVGLSHAAHRAVREYSKGMRQRLGFAQALLGSPRVLFLDEPTTGLDPEAIRAFYATLRGLREQGVTMILTSHILAELQERVDRLAIMASGQVRACGTVHALREQVDMPVRIDVRCAPDQEQITAQAVQQALVQTLFQTAPEFAMPGRITVQALAEGGLQLRCPRQAKLGVLAALISVGSVVHDLQVIEPSLEDVFFGFAD